MELHLEGVLPLLFRLELVEEGSRRRRGRGDPLLIRSLSPWQSPRPASPARLLGLRLERRRLVLRRLELYSRTQQLRRLGPRAVVDRAAAVRTGQEEQHAPRRRKDNRRVTI